MGAHPTQPSGRPFRAVVLAAIVASLLVTSAQTTQLHLVSTAWPPFTNEPGQPRFALDLVEAALARIGVTVTTTIVEDGRLTPSLLGGEFDGSAAVWRDPERERALIFSQPYLENRLILVGRRGDDVSAASLADLKGRRIAIVEGYAYGETVDNSGATFVRSRGEEDSLRLLLTAKVDYTLMDELVVQYIADNYADQARSRLQFGSRPLVTRQLYLAVRRSRPDAQTIVDRFNAQLQGMIADRTYHRLLHVRSIEADVDGDGLSEVVPASDRAGPAAPQRSYSLFATEPSVKRDPGAEQQRYYYGGVVYTGWGAVPDRYKVLDPLEPDPSKSGGPVFKFSW